MNGLQEVTVAWANWRTTVRHMKLMPWSKELQYVAMRDQMELVIAQAYYFAGMIS